MAKQKPASLCIITEVDELPPKIATFIKLLLPAKHRYFRIDQDLYDRVAECQYAAMDDCGDWYIYLNKPRLDFNEGDWVSVPHGRCNGRNDTFYIGTQQVSEGIDYKTTLIKL